MCDGVFSVLGKMNPNELFVQNRSSSCNMSNLQDFLIVKIIIYPQPFKKNVIVIIVTGVVILYFLGYNI